MHGHAAALRYHLRPVVLAALAGAALTPPSARASDFWDEVRTPGLAAYRATVSAGLGALANNRPGEALRHGDAAARALPQRPDAYVLRGRAFARLGKDRDAVAAFEHALALDPTALDAGSEVPLGDNAPGASTEAARAAVRLGRLDLARRVLLRRLATVRDDSARRRTRLLCAHVLLASGPEHLRRALRLYREALREGDGSPEATLSLALALHRDGDREGAAALAARVADAGHARIQLLPAFMPPTEGDARMALLLGARGDRAGARQHWQRVARAPGPWAAHASAGGGAR